MKYFTLPRYKYELADVVKFESGLKPARGLSVDYNNVYLSTQGTLHVLPGFQWDGASGPTFDTPATFRASLVHDALYMLLRDGYLSKKDRLRCDEILYFILVADGMSKWRAKIWLKGLKYFGARSAKRSGKVNGIRKHRARITSREPTWFQRNFKSNGALK